MLKFEVIYWEFVKLLDYEIIEIFLKQPVNLKWHQTF